MRSASGKIGSCLTLFAAALLYVASFQIDTLAVARPAAYLIALFGFLFVESAFDRDVVRWLQCGVLALVGVLFYWIWQSGAPASALFLAACLAYVATLAYFDGSLQPSSKIKAYGLPVGVLVFFTLASFVAPESLDGWMGYGSEYPIRLTTMAAIVLYAGAWVVWSDASKGGGRTAGRL